MGNLDENIENNLAHSDAGKHNPEINNNLGKNSPSTSDSSVDSKVEATSPYTPNRSNLRKRLSHPNTPNAVGNSNNANSSGLNTPNAPIVSTPTSQFLQPSSLQRRKHNSLSEKPVGRS